MTSMTQIKLLSLLVVALLHATPASWRFGAHAEQLASSAGYSAICAIGRDENENILEWVEYHKCLGVDRIYLYDHQSAAPMSAPLRDHIAAGYVIYEYTNVTHTKYAQGFTSGLDRFLTTAQGVTYRDCLQRHGRRHTFVGFVDIDELVVLEDPAVVDINQMLREYERLGGLSAYWRLLGSSGHVTRPRRGASAGAGGSGTTVSSYTACLPRGRPENTQFKSFVNTRFGPTMYSPHRATFRDPAAFLVNENFQRIPSGRNKNSTHRRISVYHYVTRSREDFMAKVKRGGGAGVTRPPGYAQRLDAACTDTCLGAQRTAARLCPHLLAAAVPPAG